MNDHLPIRIGILTCLLLFAACSQDDAPEPQPVAPVQTAVAQRSKIQRLIQARGILYPVDQAGVTPKISAPVKAFYVNRGDRVRRDQLLAVLENSDLMAAVAVAKGDYEQAESSYRSTTSVSLPEDLTKAQAEVESTRQALEAAQNLFESRKELFQQGALPRRLVDEANVAYVQARNQHDIAVKHLEALEKTGRQEQVKGAAAQLDAARGRYQAAEAQLGYSEIRSPIDGVVTDRPTYPGEMATSGTPLLTVMDISRVIARANVPSDQLTFLKVGDQARISSPDSPAQLGGRVTVVSPALDPNSTTAEVWVEAANPGNSLKPGMAAEVLVTAGEIPDAVVIPVSALLPAEAGQTAVLVVDDAPSVAHRRTVQTGVREAGSVQILSGVQAGEQVVVVGGVGLEDGAKVSVQKAGSHD
jgi:HlyD family secretion protein